MNTTIYCYSATGNSLAIARRIAGELGDCDIRSMAAQPPNRPVGGEGERAGFVFPVYYANIPRLVARYIERLEILPGTNCFALATCRDYTSSGFTLDSLEDILRKKGVSLPYADRVQMPGTYVVLYQPPKPDEARELVEDAGDRAEDAAKAIAGGASYRDKGKKPLQIRIQKDFLRSYAALDSLIRSPFGDTLAWDRKFVSDKKCTGCETCAGVCPVKNIRMKDGHPVWQHGCERCLACIHWCPNEAIQYGRITVGRRRYHHPEIKAADIIELTPNT